MTNLGFLALANCYYCKGLGQTLDIAGIAHDSANYTSNADLIERLVCGQYSTCVLIGIGSGGPAIMKSLLTPDLQQALTSWVHAGGKLLVQGEGCLAKLLQDWFGLPWEFTSYYRNDQVLVSARRDVAHDLPWGILARLPPQYSAKACHLGSVPPSSQVYCAAPVDTSVAVKAVGRTGGRVVVFGDVNAELETLALMVFMGR